MENDIYQRYYVMGSVPSCFKAVEKQIDEHYFLNMILDNLKFIILVEFIINTFTFNIIIEIIMLPVILFLFMLDTVAATKAEFLSVKKITSWIIALLGFEIFCFAFNEALSSYQNFKIVDLLVSFFIPFIFSILYMPIAYIFAIYAKYEILFLRMSFKEPNDKVIQRNHRKMVLRVCGLSYKRICQFEKGWINKMYISMEQKEFDELIKAFKATEK